MAILLRLVHCFVRAQQLITPELLMQCVGSCFERELALRRRVDAAGRLFNFNFRIHFHNYQAKVLLESMSLLDILVQFFNYLLLVADLAVLGAAVGSGTGFTEESKVTTALPPAEELLTAADLFDYLLG